MEMTQNAAQKRKEKVALLRDAVGTKGEPTAATEIDDQDGDDDNQDYYDGDKYYSHQELYPTLREELWTILSSHYVYFSIAFIVAMIAIIIALARGTHVDNTFPTEHKEHHEEKINIRWLPKETEQNKIKKILRSAIHTIHLGNENQHSFGTGNKLDDSEYLHIQGGYLGNERGHTPLPRAFYEGIWVGVRTDGFRDFFDEVNGVAKSREEIKGAAVEVGREKFDSILGDSDIIDMDAMDVIPTNIYPWQINFNNTITTAGFVLHFTIDSLREQNAFSTGPGGSPVFDKAVREGEKISRRHNGMFCVVWRPASFGPEGQGEGDEFRHISIIQEVKAARSGLQGINSMAVVWRRNGGEWTD